VRLFTCSVSLIYQLATLMCTEVTLSGNTSKRLMLLLTNLAESVQLVGNGSMQFFTALRLHHKQAWSHGIEG